MTRLRARIAIHVEEFMVDGAGGLVGAATHRVPMLEQPIPEGLHSSGLLHLEHFLKSFCLWEAYVGSVWEGLHPIGQAPCGARECNRDGSL